MRNPFKALWLVWRTYWWVKVLVFGSLALFFGLGPWHMNWLTGIETSVIIHTAHPLVLAFVVGLMFSTWLIPDGSERTGFRCVLGHDST